MNVTNSASPSNQQSPTALSRDGISIVIVVSVLTAFSRRDCFTVDILVFWHNFLTPFRDVPGAIAADTVVEMCAQGLSAPPSMDLCIVSSFGFL